MGDRTQVLIVGTGIVGSLLAYRLAEAGYDLICLEQSSRPGQASTGRSVAAFRQQFGNEGEIRLARLSSEFYEQCAHLLGTDPVLDRKGYLYLYWDQDRWTEAQRDVQIQHDAGLSEVRLLTPTEVTQRFPYVSTIDMLGATWCPTDGFFSEVPEFIAAKACEKAQAKGARFFFRHHVEKIQQDGPSALHVRAADRKTGKVHDFETAVLVNAAGAAAGDLARRAGSQLNVYPVKRYVYFTPPNTREILAAKRYDLNAFPMIICGDTGAHVRPFDTHLVLIWGKKPAEPDFTQLHPSLIESPFTEDVEEDYRVETGFHPKQFGYEVWEEIARFVPIVGELPPVQASCGYYEITRSHRACIDWDNQVSGLLHCAGFSGHGVMLAPGATLLALDKINHQLRSLPRQMEALDRFFSIGAYQQERAAGKGTL